ncbi:MAG TPA: hydantoinase/carbamoylase family amidase [Rhodopila sp.]|uniref:hydantoinase/carbamoylase family amidase n=1 Tax=Rhodopila sp. TaxID=2480087 RepID=UPI002BC7D866|nr:hydantoinase/carbamoylase family amidase [Rhodopila sp.]HVY14980.1 hydantoinase/carbamoylase family amidase [Rhodopila sp.]
MPTIDADRLLKDLYAVREIGKYKTGVHRPTYSADDVKARHWLAERFADAGLEASIDGIGNVYGRDPRPGRKLLTGSHIETQNHAGWLDGILGLIYGLETARTLKTGIDVAAFADEEGHFASFVGSRSFCGLLTEQEMDVCANRETGQPLRDALRQAGFSGRPRQQVDVARYRGYMEAHIEQGADLEDHHLRIGVVTGIVGSKRYRIAFQGQQNHAGTTRMAVRKDAGMALVKFLAAVYETFPKIANPRTVWTAGDIKLDPGAPSIVPGKAELIFQWRDTDQATLDRMDEAFHGLLAEANKGPCTATIAYSGLTVPAIMDPTLQAAIAESARKHAPGLAQAMPSGAGHDAQILSQVLPSSMLFVPSIGGISHHWTENTRDEDIVLGCQVFADAAESVLATV